MNKIKLPQIGFIGAGKVGCTLGRYFNNCGFPIYGYYSKTKTSAEEGAESTHSRVCTLAEVVAGSDLLFVTVPDTLLEHVWSQVRGLPLSGKEICHCSGLYSSQTFEGIRETGALGYSLHPFCAVNDRQTFWQQMADVYFTWEGPVQGVFFEMLLKGIGNPVEEIAAEHKPLYHAAAVFYSNLTIGLAQSAANIFRSCGLSSEFTEQAWRSLFLGNAKNMVNKGLTAALTGPIERGDAATVAKHLDKLSEPEREIYRLLSLAVLETAKQKHPDQDYHIIKEVLEV